MAMKKINNCSVAVLVFLLGIAILFVQVTYAQGTPVSLKWCIETAKEKYFPGEPILLKIIISNAGQQEANIDFGIDGIESFSIEIKNSFDEIVEKGGHIHHFGASFSEPVVISPDQTIEKLIVMNQWCSSLLSPGLYTVVCRVDQPGDYYFEKILLAEGENYKTVTKRHYLPMVTLEMPIQISSPDEGEFNRILKQLAERAFRDMVENVTEFEDRQIDREMIAFSESELAIPYQLKLLKITQSTRIKLGAINSLAKTGKLQAAVGLKDFYEHAANGMADVAPQTLEAIHKLRETGKPEILEATEEIIEKHQPEKL